MNWVRDLIVGLRGEPEPKCDSCQQPTLSEDLIPVSGGEWMCAPCLNIYMQPSKFDGRAAILLERIAELQKEVEILRRYGNKDCTAMADAAIAAEKLDAYMTEYRPGEIANND